MLKLNQSLTYSISTAASSPDLMLSNDSSLQFSTFLKNGFKNMRALFYRTGQPSITELNDYFLRDIGINRSEISQYDPFDLPSQMKYHLL